MNNITLTEENSNEVVEKILNVSKGKVFKVKIGIGFKGDAIEVIVKSVTKNKSNNIILRLDSELSPVMPITISVGDSLDTQGNSFHICGEFWNMFFVYSHDISEDIRMGKIDLCGAFYQTPFDDEPRVKDLKALLDMVSSEGTDEVQFVQVEADNCVAFGFMNITKLKKLGVVSLYDRDENNKIAKVNLIPVLNDINLEIEDHIYDFGSGVKVYLDYTFER